MDRNLARRLRLAVIFFICLCCVVVTAFAQTIQVRPMSAPDDAIQLLLRPDNTAMLILSAGDQVADQAADSPVNLSIRSFWYLDESPANVVFRMNNSSQGEKQTQTEFGQPVVLQVTTGDAQVGNSLAVWGYLEANSGDDASVTLPISLGAFGPPITPDGTVIIPAAGRVKLELDMSQYWLFGDQVQFQLTTFSSGADQQQPRFVDAAGNSVDTIILPLSASSGKLWLEIDASELKADVEYKGALRTVIANKTFVDRPIVLKRAAWTEQTKFAAIQPAYARNNTAVLRVQAAADQSIRGIYVTSETAAQEDFDPRTDLNVNLDGESLWTLAGNDSTAIQKRSLAPGEIKEITVTTQGDLPPGEHEVVLNISALNVGADNAAPAKVTFVVRNHWSIAVLVLIAAVLLSYCTTKGIVTLMNRRDLLKKISEIKDESWLKEDRWGALPIVRAFVRLELADKALKKKYQWNWLRFFSRLVTTPQLISDEVDELAERLDTFKQLNRLAVYWRAAPSDSGAVSDLDYRIVWRAHKVLRDIVDRLGQLSKGEEVPADVTAKLDKLETWSQPDSLQTEYVAAQRRDIERLLTRIDLNRYAADNVALSGLQQELTAIIQLNVNKTITDVAQQGLQASRAYQNSLVDDSIADDKGTDELRAALMPLMALLDDPANTDPQLLELIGSVNQHLAALTISARETVRDIARKLMSQQVPDSMSEIMVVEDNYIRLKLLWEQRESSQRYQSLVDSIHAGKPMEQILKDFDREIWALMKAPGTLHIVNPARNGAVEQYALVDFKVECTNPLANTFLFKHGVQYEWCIDYGGNKPLTPITRSPMVTQFIPQIDAATEVKVYVKAHWNGEEFAVTNGTVGHVVFTTVPTTRYQNLWPINAPELLGVAIALVLALVAGFQSDAFNAALEGSWSEYLTLFAWGVGAEQIKTLIQNLEKPFTSHED